MYRFCKLPLDFEPAPLLSDLRRVEAATRWIPHFVAGNYEGTWSAIALRSVGGEADHIFSDPAVAAEAYRDTPWLTQAPAFRELLRAFRCPVTSARLLRLGAGSVIKEHTDYGLTVEDGCVRLHVPIVTSPRIEFHIEDERVTMAPGQCWYIDATLRHRLANRSDRDRVHIVLDCIVDDWLRARLDEAGYRPRKKTPLEARNLRPEQFNDVIAALRAMDNGSGARHAEELEALRDGLAGER